MPVERHQDVHPLRSPPGQRRQEPGDAALVAPAAGGVEEVVAIDEQQRDAVRAPPGGRRAGRAGAGYHQAVLLLVDLDGVVYRGPEAVPGMPELLSRRAAIGDTIIYVTNNSRWHRTEYLARLAAMGAPARLEHILTSGRGTALALAHLSRPPRRTLVFGGPGLARELEDAGLATVPCVLESLVPAPDAVVVGIDFELTHERLSVAASAIRDGALFVATNCDPVFPLPARLMAGAGALVAALVAATGREPDLVIGKPEPGLLREAAAVAGVPVEEAVVIGDGLRTDILAAHRVGARSVLLLTGVSSAEMAAALPPQERPTHISKDANELEGLLEDLADGRRAA